MRIKYKASPDDIIAFTQFHYKHYSPARRKHIILSILVPITFFILLWSDELRNGRWDTLIIGVAVTAVIMLWLLVGPRRRIEKALRKTLSDGSNKLHLGERKLEITETGLVEQSEYGEGRYTWDIIERIGFTPDYTFIFISTIQGIPIARSSVLEGDYDEFGKELRRRFEDKLRTKSVQQKRDLNKKVVTDTAEIYKGDGGFGKHSGCGIASFVIAIATGVLDLLLFVSMVIMGAIIPEVTQKGSVMLRLFATVVVAGGFANIVGVVLGVSGLCQKNRKRLFAILGLVFNLAAVIVFGVLIAIGGVMS
jgi:hypothetical protein